MVAKNNLGLCYERNTYLCVNPMKLHCSVILITNTDVFIQVKLQPDANSQKYFSSTQNPK